MKNLFTALVAIAFCLLVIEPATAQIKLGKLLKDALGTEESSESSDSTDDVEVEVDMESDGVAIKNEQPISFIMEMEEIKKGKSRGKTELTIVADTWKTAMKMNTEGDEMMVIFDNQKNTMLTITESKDKRSGVEMKQPKIRVRGGKDDYEYEVTKTGETKVIDGANCEKYIITHEEGTTTSWVTSDYNIHYGELVMPLMKRMRNSPKQMDELNEIDGVPVESRTVSKDGKTETAMYIKNIKKDGAIDRSVFNVDDVEVMSLNFGF
ncbi:MAG: DUF4412 domain-containing protein [Saprospiraceae bacterium]